MPTDQTITAVLNGVSWAGVAFALIWFAVRPLVPELVAWIRVKRGASVNSNGDEVDMGMLDDKLSVLGSNHISHVQIAVDGLSKKLDDLNGNVSRGFQDLSRQMNDLNQGVAYVKGRLNGKSE